MNFKKYHVSRNLFDASAVTANRYVSDSNGQLVYYSGGTLNASDYIDISDVTYVSISYQASNNWGAFYDENKVFISGITEYSNAMQIPNNAKYMRLTVRTDTISSFMLNSGSTALPYEPYSSEVWHDTPHYIHNTSTDTITTPADIYANDNNATVGLKGNMEQQSGTTTVPSKSVTVSSLESDTNYALFPKADFPNAVVGDTINIVVSGTSYSQKVKKVDTPYVYIENREV